jgi:predicted MFS family arabinose efflux permease
MDIGVGSGAMICGVVSQAFGFTVVYIALAGCIVLSTLSYLSIHNSGKVDKNLAAQKIVTEE